MLIFSVLRDGLDRFFYPGNLEEQFIIRNFNVEFVV